MTAAAGFYEQKTLRPGGLALVIALHAAAFAGLVLVKTDVMRHDSPITRIIDVITPTPPPPEPTPPPPRPVQPTHESVIDSPPAIVRTQSQSDVTTQSQHAEPPQPLGPPARETVIAANIPDVHVPVRSEAQFDPRFAGELQPPYPPAEEAAQREGDVRVRITVGPDGRVRAIECLSATRDVFCRATERHGRSHWRFRPATVDGRPVESTKTMNIMFRIQA